MEFFRRKSAGEESTSFLDRRRKSFDKIAKILGEEYRPYGDQLNELLRENDELREELEKIDEQSSVEKAASSSLASRYAVLEQDRLEESLKWTEEKQNLLERIHLLEIKQAEVIQKSPLKPQCRSFFQQTSPIPSATSNSRSLLGTPTHHSRQNSGEVVQNATSLYKENISLREKLRRLSAEFQLLVAFQQKPDAAVVESETKELEPLIDSWEEADYELPLHNSKWGDPHENSPKTRDAAATCPNCAQMKNQLEKSRELLRLQLEILRNAALTPSDKEWNGPETPKQFSIVDTPPKSLDTNKEFWAPPVALDWNFSRTKKRHFEHGVHDREAVFDTSDLTPLVTGDQSEFGDEAEEMQTPVDKILPVASPATAKLLKSIGLRVREDSAMVVAAEKHELIRRLSREWCSDDL